MAAMTKAQSSAFAAAGGSYKTLRHHTANIVNNRRNAKLNLDKVREIRSLVNDGATYRSIAKTYGVNETSVGKIARGTLWAPMAAPNSSVFAMVA
jgi:DNA invertase Pin-like site-specific DNA recombinase